MPAPLPVPGGRGTTTGTLSGRCYRIARVVIQTISEWWGRRTPGVPELGQPMRPVRNAPA
jgi:hypothetical protein